MTNGFVYGIIGFVLGGISGGVVAGLWLGKEYKKTFDRLQYENEKLRTRGHEEKEKELDKKEKELDKKAKKIIGYEGYSPKENSEQDEDGNEFYSEDDISFDDPFDEKTSEKDEPEIRLISKEDYDMDLMTRDNETLTFYQQDGILADELDDPITNQTDVIGINAIEEAESTDKDILYVSNDLEDKIYEVVIEHTESFYRDIER